jgi:hypothetical protein
MQDNSALLIAVAGFGLVCAGTLFVALLLVLKVTGRTAFSFLGIFVRNAAQPDETELSPHYVPRPRPNLKQIAQDVDFDTAVARNVVTEEEFGVRPDAEATFDPKDLPPSRFEHLTKGDSLVNSPRRRKGDYDNDEVFGGLLDTDGDGTPDH